MTTEAARGPELIRRTVETTLEATPTMQGAPSSDARTLETTIIEVVMMLQLPPSLERVLFAKGPQPTIPEG